ncbi:MAG: hypothetical protein IKW05_00920 [Muribaculaceae bacterium]|nr:hypothetical protein [Muribaculaceae bacterium]
MKQLKNYLSILSMLIALSLLTFISCTPDTEKEDLICKVSVEISEGGIGVVSNSEVVSGEEVTLKAVAEDTYRFVNWTVNGKEVSKENPYTTTITATTQFKANFEKDNYTLKITAGEGGVVKASQEGIVLNGTKVTLTATPNEGYGFVNWTVNGEEVSTSATYTVTVTKDVEYIANFIPHKVTVIAGEGGTATANKTQLGQNGQVTLTATPNDEYVFVNWTVNGKEVSTLNPYTTNVTDDIEFVANFEYYPYNNGHEYVDLGLPSGIKWATCNVGATIPEDKGDYFAWGETEPKGSYNYYDWNTYSWNTYKWCNGSSTTMTKYCEYSSFGTVDNKTTLELADDAARVNWGGKWRMPTRAEQDELRKRSNCTWTWTIQYGVKGYKVTSNKNGNSIFLPATGFISDLGFANANVGYYWSSSLCTDDSNSSYAYNMEFSSDEIYWTHIFDRCDGKSVRAVCE